MRTVVGKMETLFKVNEGRTRYFKAAAVFPEKTKKKKSSNDDENGCGKEKGTPITLCWGRKGRLCDMGSKYHCIVRIILGKTESYLK